MPPTPLNARTGEFTPPGMTFCALKKSSLLLRQSFVYYNSYISDWWKPKAEKRFNKLQSEDRLITKLHFWDKLFGLSYEEAKQNYLKEVGR